MGARITDDGAVEVCCDGDACGAIGGRDASEEEARALAWANGFHSHVTRDDELITCPRCMAGCTHCAAIQAAPEAPGAALPWELGIIKCDWCGERVRLVNTEAWAFNVLCQGCFNHRRAVA